MKSHDFLLKLYIFLVLMFTELFLHPRPQAMDVAWSAPFVFVLPTYLICFMEEEVGAWGLLKLLWLVSKGGLQKAMPLNNPCAASLCPCVSGCPVSGLWTVHTAQPLWALWP